MDTICLFSTIRAPLSDLIVFVNYHLNTGIHKLILFFDPTGWDRNLWLVIRWEAQ